MMPAVEIAKQGLILEAVVGSTLHGLSIDGQDDRDLMGVCVEPPGYVIGLRHFEQFIIRSKPEGIKSEPGDTDRVIYSLRKYMSLALKSNPTILLLLFAPQEYLIHSTPMGRSLQELAGSIISRRAGGAYLGYMNAQHERLIGIRGQKRVKRPDLVEEHGFDTKYAGHIIRLGYQGIELLETGRLTLPMLLPQREIIQNIRRGKVSLNDVLTLSGELMHSLRELRESSPLPEEPDFDAVNCWLVHVYQRRWEGNV